MSSIVRLSVRNTLNKVVIYMTVTESRFTLGFICMCDASANLFIDKIHDSLILTLGVWWNINHLFKVNPHYLLRYQYEFVPVYFYSLWIRFHGKSVFILGEDKSVPWIFIVCKMGLYISCNGLCKTGNLGCSIQLKFCSM